VARGVDPTTRLGEVCSGTLGTVSVGDMAQERDRGSALGDISPAPANH
jgi:hypothetical protein